MTFEAHVDNIGNIGTFATLDEAKLAVTTTIEQSARADNHGIVLCEGEIVFETGEQGP